MLTNMFENKTLSKN